MKKILFVCVENSCRSQMAEAFAKIHGKDVMESYSAGSRASGKVNEKRSEQCGKSVMIWPCISQNRLTIFRTLNMIFAITMDAVMNVKCESKTKEDRAIPDPKNMNEQEFNEFGT